MELKCVYLYFLVWDKNKIDSVPQFQRRLFSPPRLWEVGSESGDLCWTVLAVRFHVIKTSERSCFPGHAGPHDARRICTNAKPALGERHRKLLVLGVGETVFRQQASISKVDTAFNEQDGSSTSNKLIQWFLSWAKQEIMFLITLKGLCILLTSGVQSLLC